MTHHRPLSSLVSFPVQVDGLTIRPATHADHRLLAERLVADRVRAPETLGRTMRIMREIVSKAGALVLDTRAAKEGVLMACGADGVARAQMEGRLVDSADGSKSASIHWAALPGSDEDTALTAARALVATLFESGCVAVSIAYDDEEPTLGAQAETLGFEPDASDPTGVRWTVSRERFLEGDEAPPHP